jgi:AcrR family transcriptional regulator
MNTLTNHQDRPARATRRAARKASTRRLVLDAAYDLFEERGYDQATMRELAGRAGVALGTIFAHFPDKPSLLVAAFETDIARVIEAGFATLPQADLPAQLLHLAGALYAFYARRPRLSRALVENTIFMEGPGASALAAQVQSFLGRVSQLFAAAQARGEVRRDLSPGDGALVFWADYFTALVAGLQAPRLGREGQLRLLGLALELRFDGLRPLPARGARTRR